MKVAAKRTLRKQLMVQSGLNRRAVAKSKRQAHGGVRHYVNQADVPPLSLFTGLDAQVCKMLDVETDAVRTCTLGFWLEGGVFATHALLLLGPAQWGKTPLCRAFASVIAKATQESGRPHFLQSSTLDSLRSVSSSLAEAVPIILDDWTASTASRLSEDQLKHVLTTTGREVLVARYEDVALPQGARIISANSPTLHDWYGSFPQGLWEMSATARQALPANTQALLKRLAVCCLTAPLMQATTAKRHRSEATAIAASKVARVLDRSNPGSVRGEDIE